MRRLLALVVAASFLAAVPASADDTLSRRGQKVTWQGELTVPDPGGCDDVTSHGCVRHPLAVRAAKGEWITVSTDASYVRVTENDAYVASNGMTTNTREIQTTRSSVTFQQLRAGTVTYTVGVSSPVTVSYPATPFHATATLSGKAFDREGECFVNDSGAAALLAPDDGKRLKLSVRLVADPADAVIARKAGAAVIETYDRIGITVRVSYDLRHIDVPDDGSDPWLYVKQAYGGRRPAGVDAVHVISDQFAGGLADCIGGVAYPERGFSVGSAHYLAGGIYQVDALQPAGVIAAHEIGHTLGGQHQMVSCAEAVPQEQARPASDGWVGPCTVMAPAAAQSSETWSLVEKASVRSYVRRFAHG